MVKHRRYIFLFLFIIIIFLNDTIILTYSSFSNDLSLIIPKVYYFYEEGIIANAGNDYIKLNQSDRCYELLMNSSFQKSFLVNTSHKVINFFYDEDGMPMIELDIPSELPPKSYIKYYVTQKIEIYGSFSIPEDLSYEKSGSLSDIKNTYYKLKLFSETTAPTGVWKYNDTNWEYLIKKAEELKGNDENVLRIVCSFIDWIGKNIAYPKDGSELPKYPNETITLENIEMKTKGIGDCDDQANLLILLCRAIGIPAYLQAGGIILYKEKYKNSEIAWNGHLNYYYGYVGWHGWAMVYIPPWGWLPVDLTWGYYGLGKKDPLTAIKYSAIAIQEIMYLRNYYSIDYVKETREFKKMVEDKNLYFYINYLVIPEGKSIRDEIDNFPKYNLSWMNVTTHETKTTSTYIIKKYEDKLNIYLIIVLTMLTILSIIILISIFKRFRSKRISERSLYLY
ncbi:MAG: transglutaminase-like domain-containing protein [Nitrososphaerota archaeon]